MDTFNEALKQYLLNTFSDARQVSGGKEVVIRCRFCGDSRNQSSRHLYIFCGDNSRPPMYHCFKCDESGVLTRKVLSELEGYSGSIDQNLLYELDKRNAEWEKKSRYYPKQNNIYNMVWGYKRGDQYDDLDGFKVKYISDRIGYNFGWRDIWNCKIILNLREFLQYNKIEQFTRSQSDIDTLSRYYIGFLSMDNGFVTLRQLPNRANLPDYYKRYMVYNIFGAQSSNLRYYCIPTSLRVMGIDPIHIRIAEGPVDILSISHNLRYDDSGPNIYISSNGKGYINVVKSLLELYPLVNIAIHLYPDNDVPDYYFTWFLKSLNRLYIPTFIHRNIFPGEKDFGVPLDHIRENIERIR